MKRRKFTNDYKREALRLVLEQGLKVAEAARDLGVTESTLHNWLKKERDAMLDPASPKVHEHEELKRLRKQVARLNREKEILEKATAYFAKISG